LFLVSAPVACGDRDAVAGLPGACGAALADLGFPHGLLRGLALLARTAGLLGHLAGEMRRHRPGWLYRQAGKSVRYQPPDGGQPPQWPANSDSVT
jgi:hypothetical protein